MTTYIHENPSVDTNISPVHDILDVESTDCCIVGGRTQE